MSGETFPLVNNDYYSQIKLTNSDNDDDVFALETGFILIYLMNVCLRHFYQANYHN